MEQTTPLVSIIVPVYKVEKYLPTCIDSILGQTYENFELILVDDGTPDSCGKICDDYASKDNRIKVFHKPNGGVSSARNIGIDNAKGYFVTFVDADDYIYPNCIEFLVSHCEKFDWIFSGYATNGHEIKPPFATYEDKDIELFWKQYANTLFCATTWSAMYKLEIIQQNKIYFDTNIRLGEDTLFNANYLFYCKKIKLLPEILYFYNAPISHTISNKYNIHYSEILYQINQTKQIYKKLSFKYNLAQQLEQRIKTILSFYPYTRLTCPNDTNIIQLYLDNIPNSTLNTYYSDPICSPINKGLQYLKECYKKKLPNRKVLAEIFYKQYHTYFNLFKPPYKVDKILLLSLKLKTFYLTEILMYIYLKLKTK